MNVNYHHILLLRQCAEEQLGANLYRIEMVWDTALTDPLPQNQSYVGVVHNLQASAVAAPFVPFIAAFAPGYGQLVMTMHPEVAKATVGAAINAAVTLSGIA